MTPQKTYKREVGGFMLLALAVLFGYALAVDNERAVDVAKFLTTPVFMFAAGAFGLDAVAKQFR